MIININGAKNSSLPIIACTLLCKGKYTINNVPEISDVSNMLELMKQFNITYKFKKNKLKINSKNFKLPEILKYNSNFRASYYLIGSTCNEIQNSFNYKYSKGCDIGKRPINYHIDFIKKLGFNVKTKKNNLEITTTQIVKNKNKLEYDCKKSVGTTINCLILSVKSKKNTFLRNYSHEPYIFDTINFLKKMGASINVKDEYINIIGNENLNVCNYKIMYDPIETVTYMILSGLLNYKNIHKNVIVGPIILNNLGKLNFLLEKIGCILIPIKSKNKYYKITFNPKIFTEKQLIIKTGYYPEIYTDIQPMLTLLLNELGIKTIITENVWEDRLKYVVELNRLGYTNKIDGNTVCIIPQKIEYKRVNKLNNYDLRADASLLIASLLSRNYKKDIMDLKYINRGYSNLNENILCIHKLINNNDEHQVLE